ncbi:PRAME family member 8-like [Ochotona curzoniae]|uniref:PRAME family member 8-like n=1 Tax=Ochotona curzoniae TaxID=130825 RepID=UPI001B34AE56|nr:PRAME family member 8-like [Ochotona curzoniae]
MFPQGCHSGLSRTSSRSPPRLLHLAQKSLLSNEALAILSLDQLPREMFPALFVEVFNRRLLNILKAMVRVWPFEVLRLGALMKRKQVDNLKAVLDGIDLMYAQNSDSRRGKLHVLDLRDAGWNIWNLWAQSIDDEPKARRQPVEHKRPKSALKVIANIYVPEVIQDQFLPHLLLWVKERARLVHLCCHQLKISVKSIHTFSRILDVLDLSCTQEVQVDSTQLLFTLTELAPYLDGMSSLHTLCVSHYGRLNHVTPEHKELFNSDFAAQLAKLPHLRNLHLASVCFLEDNLEQVLRCLRSPLEALSVTGCLLSEVDVCSLSQCPSLCELQHLYLSGIPLTHISPEPLRVLLERVAATLMTLDLLHCEMTDSHLNAMLPALSQCYQLSTFNFLGNGISMAMMEELVEHTGSLSALRVEQYPAPLESYRTQGIAHAPRFFQHCAELLRRLQRRRQPKQVLFSTVPCSNCSRWMVFGLKLRKWCECYLQD